MTSLLVRWTASGRFGGWRGVVLALVLTVLAAFCRAALEALAPSAAPVAPFFVSTIVAALLAGLWIGVAALVAGLLTAWYVFMPPVFSFALAPGGAASLLIFFLTGLVLAVIGAALRDALRVAAAAERALQGKVAELEALMDMAPVGIWFARAPTVQQVRRNRFAAELMRMPAESDAAFAPAAPGTARVTHLTLQQDGRPVPAEDLPLQRAMRGAENRNVEYQAVFADGSSIDLLSNSVPIRDASGRILGAVSASLDVTELKRTEAALREAVAARELLQREADHRIKNSLQLVSAMLRLQRDRVTDPDAAIALDEAVTRVAAVAQAHGALQGSADLKVIDAAEMVRDLCGFVGQLNPAVAIACRSAGNTRLDTERAIPLGLVVNEVLTNAVRHAYPAGTPGQVEVDVRGEGNALVIELRDHGIGMAPDAHRPGSLGRDLVRTLSAQIGARVEVGSVPGQGTTVTLRLPRPGAAAPRATAASAA